MMLYDVINIIYKYKYYLLLKYNSSILDNTTILVTLTILLWSLLTMKVGHVNIK